MPNVLVVKDAFLGLNLVKEEGAVLFLPDAELLHGGLHALSGSGVGPDLHPVGGQLGGLGDIVAHLLGLEGSLPILPPGGHRDPALILGYYRHHPIIPLRIRKCLLILLLLQNSEVIRDLPLIRLILQTILRHNPFFSIKILLLIRSHL